MHCWFESRQYQTLYDRYNKTTKDTPRKLPKTIEIYSEKYFYYCYYIGKRNKHLWHRIECLLVLSELVVSYQPAEAAVDFAAKAPAVSADAVAVSALPVAEDAAPEEEVNEGHVSYKESQPRTFSASEFDTGCDEET